MELEEKFQHKSSQPPFSLKNVDSNKKLLLICLFLFIFF